MSLVKNLLKFSSTWKNILPYTIVINQDEITDQAEINTQIFSFYQSLFSHNIQNQIDI